MPKGLIGGSAYLVRERRGQAAFDLFSRLTRAERPGLCVTRKHPEVARAQWDLPAQVGLKWLTPSVGKDRVDPKSLNLLAKIVYEFVLEDPEGVVLLDGLEYLLLHNDFSKTLLFVEQLNDLIMESRAILLAPINPDALEEQDLALLERNAEVLEGDQLVSEARVEKYVKLIDRYLRG